MATLGIFEPVPQRERRAIPAGSFEDRPWWDRVNPFTPIHSKRFVPTPQAQEIISNFEKNHNKRVDILPNDPKVNAQELANNRRIPGGYFPTHELKGGPLDPFSRRIHLNPESGNNLWVLAHELGHAGDPALRFGPIQRSPLYRNVKRLAGTIFNRQPNNIYDAYDEYSKGPIETFKSEVIAQDAAEEAYKKYGLSDEISQDTVHKFGYPHSFINKFHREVEEDFTNPANHGWGTYNQITGENYDLSGMRRDMLLKLAFDDEYQKRKSDVNKFANEYANMFLDTPTP